MAAAVKRPLLSRKQRATLTHGATSGSRPYIVAQQLRGNRIRTLRIKDRVRKPTIETISRLGLVLLHSLGSLILVGGSRVWAQQPPAAGPPPPSDHGSPPAASTQPKNDRIFGVLPNYRTVENPQLGTPASTTRAKFHLAVEDSFDPYAYPVAGIFAGLAQIRNDPRSWGEESWGPFTKRYFASFADQTDENIMTEAVVPSLLKQDPRYFRLGSGGFLKRTSYAVSRIWMTRTDTGGKTFNFSEILGAGASTAVSNLYYPPENRTLSNNLSQWGILVGEDAFFNILKEYWPDIRHRVLKR